MDFLYFRETICALQTSINQGHLNQGYSLTCTQTDAHDRLVASCMTTSAVGNEAVGISAGERKLRLVVCRAISLFCSLISGESKVTKPQATSQSADCYAARLLFKFWFTDVYQCFFYINTVISNLNNFNSLNDICIPHSCRTNKGFTPEQIITDSNYLLAKISFLNISTVPSSDLNKCNI